MTCVPEPELGQCWQFQLEILIRDESSIRKVQSNLEVQDFERFVAYKRWI
jgi:hypothetical protein